MIESESISEIFIHTSYENTVFHKISIKNYKLISTNFDSSNINIAKYVIEEHEFCYSHERGMKIEIKN